MASLNFTNQETTILTSWLNQVNQVVYGIFLEPDTIDDVVTLLPEATQSSKGLINGADQEKVNDIDSIFRIQNLEVEEITSSRTLTLDDRYKYLRVNSASEVTISIPQDNVEDFEIGDFIYRKRDLVILLFLLLVSSLSIALSHLLFLLSIGL